jgi:hypothetical protein
MAEERKIVKSGPNYKIYSDGTILVSDVRASYPHLDKKWCKNPQKDTPAYSLTGILPNDTHKEAREAILAFCQDMLNERNKGGKIKADAYFVRDGDLSGKDEYEDAWIVAARESDNRPVVLNPDRSEMDVEDIKGTIKAGYRVDMLVEPWWQDNEHGKRINSSLRAVRFRREDTPIAEGGISKDEAISSFDDDEDGGFGGDDENGGL